MDEIWIKLGGDKGGGSFKLMLQVANVDNPNSRRNTSVICVFAASETAANLHIGIAHYKTQVEALSTTTWR